VRLVSAARRRGERVVFTNGCFDPLHTGHVRSLEEAASLGDVLVVAVNGDASVSRLKGRGRPALPARIRCEVVAALACVDRVVRFDADTPLALIRRIVPDVLAKGGDWPADAIVGRDVVEAAGGRVVRLANVPGPRSSDLIAAIRRRR
jgi:D-beta-D-heptose 7-phosphate kinase/D-beta-D-heptose 1-phosphate adenosyltransferase